MGSEMCIRDRSMVMERISMASEAFSNYILNKISLSPTNSTNTLHATTSNVSEGSTGSPEVETDEDEVVCQQKMCHSPLGLYKLCKISVKNSTGNIDVCEALLKVGIDYIRSNCSTIYD